MELGRKSIIVEIAVNNDDNCKVVVQANKNFTICNMSPRIGEVLSTFQGRQLVYKDSISGNILNNTETVLKLKNALYTALNTKKEN